jgi:hypothetical protein
MVTNESQCDDFPIIKMPQEWYDQSNHIWGFGRQRRQLNQLKSVNNGSPSNIERKSGTSPWEEYQLTNEKKKLFVLLFKEVNPEWHVSEKYIKIECTYDSPTVFTFFNSNFTEEEEEEEG